MRGSRRKWLCRALGVGRKLLGEFSHSRGRGTTGRSSRPPAAAMAKGRVAERTQTGPLHSTPAGDPATGTQGSTTPGSRDHLKGEWTCGPELRLLPKVEGSSPPASLRERRTSAPKDRSRRVVYLAGGPHDRGSDS